MQALRKSLLEQARVVFEVPEAPVFRPTAVEFQDPLEYIASINAEVAPCGIAKIIPPPGVLLSAAAQMPRTHHSWAATHGWCQGLLCCMGGRRPPASSDADWKNPQLNLNVKRFFKTKRQKVHMLQEGQPFGDVSTCLCLTCLLSSPSCPQATLKVLTSKIQAASSSL